MPFRAKVKRAFGTSNTEYDPANPLTHSISKKSKKDYPDNVYKPGEAMPRPKYRGPWNQAHQDKLSSFSFGDAWKRRKSSAETNISAPGADSEYSPMGSRLPSRGTSRRNSAWSAISGKVGKRAWGMGSRQGSHSGYDGYVDRNGNGRVEETGEEDGDIANAGLSRQNTVDKPPTPPPKDDFGGLIPPKTITNGHPNGYANGHVIGAQSLNTMRTFTNGQLFTADELANAMSQSTLTPSKRERS